MAVEVRARESGHAYFELWAVIAIQGKVSGRVAHEVNSSMNLRPKHSETAATCSI